MKDFRARVLLLAPEAACCFIFAVLFLADRLPRFYQGDSLAYLSTGLNGWIPPDRSWAYGFASRWLLQLTHTAASLVALQLVMLLAAILCLCRAFGRSPRGRWAALVFAVLASVDPLNQVYARFWLSDTAAAAAFLGFVGLAGVSIAGSGGRLVHALLVATSVISIFLRIAYVPMELATLAIAFGATFLPGARQRLPWIRKRLLVLAAAPILSAAALAVANARVAMPDYRGDISLNHASPLFTMGVFLPGLRYEDFQQAGAPMSPAEFERLDLGNYDKRELQMWADSPQFLRYFLQQKLGARTKYDPRLLRLSASVMHAALLHHPQTLAWVYIRVLGLYFNPLEWTGSFDQQMGYARPLPDWAANFLTRHTRHVVPANVTASPSLLPMALGAVIGATPVLLLAGLVAAVGSLLGRRDFGMRQMAASALLGTVFAVPLYSHMVVPRYLLCAVTLCMFVLSASLFAEKQGRPKEGSSSFLKKRTKKLLFLERTLPDGRATAT